MSPEGLAVEVRVRTRRLDAAWWASLAVALATLALCVAGGLRTGMSWDELEHRNYGEMALDFYRSLGEDRTAATHVMRYYGALHVLAGAAAEQLLPFLPWPSARHLAAVAFSLVGFVYCVRLGRLLGGPWAGFAAALLLATTPRWVGDSMFNPIDVPTAGMYCAALYYLARIAGALGSARLSDWLRFGLFAGLTLGVRMVGILLVPYAGLSIAAWALLALRSRRADLYRHGPRIVAGFLLATAATIAVSFALWPRMLVEPLTGLADSLVRTQDYPWTGDVLFRGEYYSANALPPSYLAVWFGITTPIATMLGLALALALRARWLPLESAALLRAGIVLFAVLFPPTYATLSHATLYDGIRHFLFVLPPLAALAGCGWGALFAVAAAWRRRAVRAGAVALVAAVAEPLVWYARSYPHAYVYFNPLAGGIARASHRYETDYWALTIREAAEWMVAHRREIVGSDAPMRVVTSSSWHLFSPWLDDSSKYVEVQNDEPFHVGVVHTRFQPLGWAERARPTRHKVIAEGQVPFWQLFVGPLSKAARPRERR